MLIFIIIRSDYYYSRTLVITEFASSSCRTKRNGLDLRCALYFSSRSAFSTTIFASSRTLASCSSSSSTLFQLSFPLQNKKIFTLHFTRYARFASYLEENRDRYVCFRTNRFPMFRILSPSLVPCSPLSPFSSLLFLFLFLSASGFFRISSPSLTCYFCFQICHSHLRPFSPATPSPTPHNPLVVVTPELRSSSGYFDFVRSITQREFLSCGVSSRLFFPAIITTTASTSSSSSFSFSFSSTSPTTDFIRTSLPLSRRQAKPR